ncbi:MAG: hydrolase [Gammaproteobacteria bacterium]|nr:MAG: hydrolase [Gammaproteobacteria bacterium]
MPTISMNKPNRLLQENTQAMIIDVQEKFVPHIHQIDKTCQKIAILAQGLQLLSIPVMLNEQYPKGLGKTVNSINDVLTETNQRVFEKQEFSVCDCDASWNHVAKQNRNNVILCGIEAHVCVQQTALDLLDNGMQPILIADAVSSRNEFDKQMSIERMRHAGAIVTTVEGILFEMCKTSKHEAFRAISKLVT